MADNKTIGAAGDYTTVPLWAAYVTGLGTLTQDTNGLHLNEATTSASQTLLAPAGGLGGFALALRAQTGASFVDLRSPTADPLTYGSPGARAACTGNGVGQNFRTDVTCSLIGMQLTKTGPYSGVFQGDFRAQQLIVLRNDTSGDATFSSDSGSLNTWTDCLFILQTNSNGFNNYGFGGSFYNCALVNTAGGSGKQGFKSTYGTFIAKNCVVYGFATNYAGTASASSTNNATDAASFGGTNWGTAGQVSIVGATEWESATGAGDWRLKSTSAKLKANGTTGTGVSSTDIFGNTWNSPPDIGPIRFPPATGPITFPGQNVKRYLMPIGQRRATRRSSVMFTT